MNRVSSRKQKSATKEWPLKTEHLLRAAFFGRVRRFDISERFRDDNTLRRHILKPEARLIDPSRSGIQTVTFMHSGEFVLEYGKLVDLAELFEHWSEIFVFKVARYLTNKQFDRVGILDRKAVTVRATRIAHQSGTSRIDASDERVDHARDGINHHVLLLYDLKARLQLKMIGNLIMVMTMLTVIVDDDVRLLLHHLTRSWHT